jgi:transcriptional regulator with GAF, ATPase, and Fis domain
MVTVLVEEDVIGPEHFPRSLAAAPPVPGLEGLSFAEAVSRFERSLLVRAIEAAGGVKARAAEALGLDSNQMKYLSRKHGL